MYFNEAQIQRIADEFPQEIKDSVEFKKAISCESSVRPKGTIAEVIEYNDMRVFRSMRNSVIVEFSFESSTTNYENPTETFKTELTAINKELSNIFAYKVNANIYIVSFGKEPDPIPPLYWGTFEENAKYRLCIEICIDSPL